MLRSYRKPLIVVAPKKLLKYKGANSNIEDLATGTMFKRVIEESYPEEVTKDNEISRVIFCSG